MRSAAEVVALLSTVAGRQLGLFTRQDAIEHRVSSERIRRLIAEGVIERVTPSVLAARRATGTATPEEVLVEHVRESVDQLARRSVVVAEAVAAGRCAVVGAVYALGDGEARVVEVVGQLE